MAGYKFLLFTFFSLLILWLFSTNHLYARKVRKPSTSNTLAVATSPTSAPTPTSTPTPTVLSVSSDPKKYFGVNVSVAEFGEGQMPGVLGKDYMYPIDMQRNIYFASKNLNLLRLPIRWERVQHENFKELSYNDIQQIRKYLDDAQTTNQKVLIDLHNYGRFYGFELRSYDGPKLADFWRRFATEFKDHPALFGYELMNEPHDLSDGSDGWKKVVQETVAAIRLVDQKNWIVVPGYSWQTARFWEDNNANLIISDPNDKLIYSAHQYFDSDFTGSYQKGYDADGVYPTIGADRVQPFLNWLKKNNVKGMLTEYGVPGNDDRWNTVLDNFMKTLQNDPNIVGGTYWSSGPWWGGYPLSVEPGASMVDQPQMRILKQYPTK